MDYAIAARGFDMGAARQQQIEAFFAQRRDWRTPDIVINPVGTLVLHDGRGWVCSPWLEEFMREIRGRYHGADDPLVMLSVPAHRSGAGLWDLALLESGLSTYFGKAEYLWPKPMPLSAIVALRNIGYPPGVEPITYIDCLPDRILNTMRNKDTAHPDRIIYWRPSDQSITTMDRFGIGWVDKEEDLLDIVQVQFAGQPEDVVAVFEP